MAILERPLFGDEARGRIKNTLVFLKRVANIEYTDVDPGERFIVNAIRAPRQAHGAEREAQKEAYRAACDQWGELSDGEKAAYWPYAEGLETNFNVFLREVLGGEEIMPQPFTGEVLVALLTDTLSLIAEGQPRQEELLLISEEGAQTAEGNAGETIGFSYAIP